VCVKRVPDTAENEIEVNGDGSDIERDDLVYSVNEWDNYAVEEAIQIRDNVGGSVTVVTVGDDESEEVLRREMAMGADNGLLLCDDAFDGSDGKGVATLLKAAVEKGKYDLILTGAQADDGAGEGGRHAGGHAGLSLRLTGQQNRVDGDKLKVGREIEGGNQEMNEIRVALRAVHPDRHQRTALRGHPRHPQGGLGGDSPDGCRRPGRGPGRSAGAKRLDYFVPEMGEGAEMLEGSDEEIIAKLIELLKAKGGLK
jgi:electron transfer flavoprotein beta subunit